MMGEIVPCARATGKDIKCGPMLDNDVERVQILASPQSPSRHTVFITFVLFLTLLSLGLFLILIFYGPLSFLIETKSFKSEFSGICDTRECVEVSYRILSSGDFSLNPCDDFFHYTCSKWQTENPVASEQLYHAANANLLTDQVDLKIKELLEKESENSRGNNGASAMAFVSFYKSCINFTNHKEETIVGDLLESLGGYQGSETWSDARFDLTNLTLELLHVNGAPLFDITLDIDAKDRSRYALIVELPRPTSLVLSLFPASRRTEDLQAILQEHAFQSFTKNSAIEALNTSSTSGLLDRQRLYKIITESLEGKKLEQLKLLVQKTCRSLNLTEKEVTEDVNAISHLASNIRKLMPSQRTRKLLKQQNRVYNGYTLKSLQSEFPAIDWARLFSGLMEMGSGGNTGNGSRLLDYWQNTKIYVPYPEYLQRLFSTIQYADKRILQNMMLIVYGRDMLNDLAEKKNEEERSKFCVQSTKSVFAMELSALFVRSYQTSHLDIVRQDIYQIFKHVQGSVISFLRQSEWLGAETKAKAISKIEALKGRFLGPSFYFQDNYLVDTVKMNSSDFYSNIRLIYRVFREQLYQMYLAGVDEEKATWAFVAFPFTVNAFYIQQFNSIVIPLAFLSPPQYTARAPNYVNYATIALTIAHETLHALDGSGSGFDAQGRLQDWWSAESRSHLNEKSACVAKQYSENFQKLIPFYEKTVPIQVDGNLTQNENIADIAGLQVAYDAFIHQRSERDIDNHKIPGLNLTQDQLFFVIAAQAYCANIAPMGYVFLLEADEHTTHDFRINGMMMNFPKFAEAFKCSPGSAMNPKLKCSFW